jgi:phosphoribosylglycinamide formyltransferase-1
MERMKVAVMASGRGTDFQSLVDAVEGGRLQVELVLLVCNNRDAPVIERARRHGVPWKYIDHRGRTREAFEQDVMGALEASGTELVVLAGFMRLLSPFFIGRFRNRIINIHPSLLPAFPGPHAQRDALAHGVRVSGCTVHFVDESLDGGPIILQRAVPVLEDDTEETLASRILEDEHRLLPLAVQLFAEGRLRLDGRKVRIDSEGFSPGLPPPC